MSYKEWLYDELVNDGFIDESEYEADELTKSLILTSTEVDEDDLDNYAEQFKEHCDSRGDTPDWDLEDQSVKQTVVLNTQSIVVASLRSSVALQYIFKFYLPFQGNILLFTLPDMGHRKGDYLL